MVRQDCGIVVSIREVAEENLFMVVVHDVEYGAVVVFEDVWVEGDGVHFEVGKKKKEGGGRLVGGFLNDQQTESITSV